MQTAYIFKTYFKLELLFLAFVQSKSTVLCALNKAMQQIASA